MIVPMRHLTLLCLEAEKKQALAKLAELAERIPPGASELEDHGAYCLGLKKAHGRKTGFWTLVNGNIGLSA